MNIWIVNQYASLPTDGIGGRHRHLARELAALGHEVTVVAARLNHLTRDVAAARAAATEERFEGFRFVRVDVPESRTSRGWRRILSWVVFALKLPGLPHRLNERPDVVVYSSPSLLGFPGAEILARKTGARLIFEVRDIWPLTLMEVGSYSARHPFIRLLQWIEDGAYCNADRVISNLRGAVEHMARRGMDRRKFAWAPNGISASEPRDPPNAAIEAFRLARRGRFTVGYAGTLGEANALETLIGAATALRNEKDVLFALTGSGPEKQNLESAVARLGLDNVMFVPPVPKAQVLNLLEAFDVCVICWRRLRLYEFGTAANKLFDYFNAGKPVVQAYSGRFDLVAEYGAGLTTPAEESEALAGAVLQLRAMTPQERAKLGANGRVATLRHHEYREIARRLESVLIS